MHGYVASHKDAKAQQRLGTFGHVMYAQMGFLVLVGIAVAVRWWPVMRPTNPDASTVSYLFAIFWLLALVFTFLWSGWYWVLRPTTAFIMFRKLKGDVLRTDRSVRRYRFAFTSSGTATGVEDAYYYDMQQVVENAILGFEHELQTRVDVAVAEFARKHNRMKRGERRDD